MRPSRFLSRPDSYWTETCFGLSWLISYYIQGLSKWWKLGSDSPTRFLILCYVWLDARFKKPLLVTFSLLFFFFLFPLLLCGLRSNFPRASRHVQSILSPKLRRAFDCNEAVRNEARIRRIRASSTCDGGMRNDVICIFFLLGKAFFLSRIWMTFFFFVKRFLVCSWFALWIINE